MCARFPPRPRGAGFFLSVVWLMVLVGCGGSDGQTGPGPGEGPPLEPAAAAAEARLALAAYRQLDDFLAGRTFTPPAEYALRETLFAPLAVTGELYGGHERVPMGFVAVREDVIHVALRGTSTVEDWLANLDFPQAPVRWLPVSGRAYEGFLRVYGALRGPLLAAVDRLLASGVYGRIAVTGHSLGGALAVLAAADLAQRTGLSVRMVNFGAPRVGDPVFAAWYVGAVGDSWRVVNVHDPVPDLPPREVVDLSGGRPVVRTYVHVPRALRVAFGAETNPGGSHDLCGYHRVLCGAAPAPAACRASAAALGCGGG